MAELCGAYVASFTPSHATCFLYGCLIEVGNVWPRITVGIQQVWF